MKRLLPALILCLAATFGASSPAFSHAASTSFLILDLPASDGPVAVRWDLSLHDIVWVVFIDADYDGNPSRYRQVPNEFLDFQFGRAPEGRPDEGLTRG